MRGVIAQGSIRPGRVWAFVRLLRPRQWIKNSFVLAPLIFSGMFIHVISVECAILATVLFWVASS